MPTIFTHSIAGIASGTAVRGESFSNRFWALSVICSIIPDADVISFKLGIPYAHFFGHRGFFHSLFFACMLGSAVGILLMNAKEWKNRFLFAGYFSFLISFHDILDAFTNGGLGIALLSPFNTKRYFFWATPIEVSPISLEKFLNGRGLAILANEFLWVWLPCIGFALLARIFVKSLQRGKLFINSLAFEKDL